MFIKILKKTIRKKRKVLTVFDDIIADMISNEKLNPVVTELYTRGIKLNISLVFITQSYFKIPKEVELCCTFFSKFQTRELPKIAINHSLEVV